MPLYRFATTRAGNTVTQDPVELPDNKAAWEEATASMGEMLKDIDGDLRQGGDLKMTVCEGEKPIFTVRISSVVHSGEAFP